MAKQKLEDLDWTNLGFNYRDLPYSYNEEFKDGKWQNGGLTTDSSLTFNEAAEELHYGQEVFEGMKAYRTKDGKIQLFRPDMNAKRFTNSAKRLVMETYPEDKFVEAVKEVVKANADFVPPYGSGGSLYIRPFMLELNQLLVLHHHQLIHSIFMQHRLVHTLRDLSQCLIWSANMTGLLMLVLVKPRLPETTPVVY